VSRHVYQSAVGGKTYCPLEVKAKLISGTTTPMFAKMVGFKYAHMSASLVCEDLKMSHGRPTSTKLIQRISDQVSELGIEAAHELAYDLPQMPAPVHFIALGVDGTTTPIREQGYKETMCGTLSLYNKEGQRMHTIYTACAPQSGKGGFSMRGRPCGHGLGDHQTQETIGGCSLY